MLKFFRISGISFNSPTLKLTAERRAELPPIKLRFEPFGARQFMGHPVWIERHSHAIRQGPKWGARSSDKVVSRPYSAHHLANILFFQRFML